MLRLFKQHPIGEAACYLLRCHQHSTMSSRCWVTVALTQQVRCSSTSESIRTTTTVTTSNDKSTTLSLTTAIRNSSSPNASTANRRQRRRAKARNMKKLLARTQQSSTSWQRPHGDSCAQQPETAIEDPHKLRSELQRWFERHVPSGCFDKLAGTLVDGSLLIRVRKDSALQPATATDERPASSSYIVEYELPSSTTAPSPSSQQASTLNDDAHVDTTFEDLLSESDLSTVAVPSIPRATHQNVTSIHQSQPRNLKRQAKHEAPSPHINKPAAVVESPPLSFHKKEADALLDNVRTTLQNMFHSSGGVISVVCDLSRSCDLADEDDADVIGNGGDSVVRPTITKYVDVVVASIVITLPSVSTGGSTNVLSPLAEQPSEHAPRRPLLFRNDDNNQSNSKRTTSVSTTSMAQENQQRPSPSFVSSGKTVVGEGAGVNELDAVIEALIDAFTEADMELPECVTSTKRKLVEQGSLLDAANRNTSNFNRKDGRGPLAPLMRSVAGQMWKSIVESLAASPLRTESGASSSRPLAHAILQVTSAPLPQQGTETVSVVIKGVDETKRICALELCAADHNDASLITEKQVLASVKLTTIATNDAAALFPALPMEYLRCLDLAAAALQQRDDVVGGRPPLARLDALLGSMPCLIPMAARGSYHSVAKWTSGHYLGARRSLSHSHEVGKNYNLTTTTSMWLPMDASSLARRVILDPRDGSSKKRLKAVSGCLGYEFTVARGAPARSNGDAREAALSAFLGVGASAAPSSGADAVAEDERSTSTNFPFPAEFHGQISAPAFLNTISSLRSFSQTLQLVGAPPPFERGIVSQLKWLGSARGEEMNIESTKMERTSNSTCWRTKVSARKIKGENESATTDCHQWVVLTDLKDYKKSNSILRAVTSTFDLPQYRSLMTDQLYGRFRDDAASICAATANSATQQRLLEGDDWVTCDESVGTTSPSTTTTTTRTAGAAAATTPNIIAELESVTNSTTTIGDFRRGPSLLSSIQRAICEVVEDVDFVEFVKATLGLPHVGSLKTESSIDTTLGGTASYRFYLVALTEGTAIATIALCETDIDVSRLVAPPPVATQQKEGPVALSSSPSSLSWQLSVLCPLFAQWAAMFRLSPEIAASQLRLKETSSSDDNSQKKSIRNRFWTASRAIVNEAAEFCNLPTPDRHEAPSSSWLSGDSSLPRCVPHVDLGSGGQRAHPLSTVNDHFIKVFGGALAVHVRAANQCGAEPIPRHQFTISAAHHHINTAKGEPSEAALTFQPIISSCGATKTAARLAACTALIERCICPLISTCRARQQAPSHDAECRENTVVERAVSQSTKENVRPPSASETDSSLFLTFPPLELNSVGGQLISAIFQTFASPPAPSAVSGDEVAAFDDVSSIDAVRFGVLYQPTIDNDAMVSQGTSRRPRMFTPYVEIEYSISNFVTGGGPGKFIRLTPVCTSKENDATTLEEDGSSSIFMAITAMWSALVAQHSSSSLSQQTEAGPHNNNSTTLWETLYPLSVSDDATTSSTNVAISRAESHLLARWNDANHLSRLASLSRHVVQSTFAPPRVLQQSVPSQLIDVYSKRFFGISLFTNSEIVPRSTDWRTELTAEVIVRRPVQVLSAVAEQQQQDADQHHTTESPRHCHFILGASIGQGKKVSYKLSAVPLLRSELVGTVQQLLQSVGGQQDQSRRGMISQSSSFWDSDHFSLPSEGRNTTAELIVRIISV
ncbi:Hypothetical protein, putative [Bodo saltans]|uniref:Uncharacterized protein n=1 Tax=Bodo saltans TaxID=75058 RepID=A0A0S4JDW0_BODSA|nr:Hypothetical protein, putative [Bodo saltans]|eukprot:CUG89658.1 Hypothetical protein, putative [Bodo saltans]